MSPVIPPHFSHKRHYGEGPLGFNMDVQIVESKKGTKRIFLRFTPDIPDLMAEPPQWESFAEKLLNCIPDLSIIGEPDTWPGNIQNCAFFYSGESSTQEISDYIVSAMEESQAQTKLITTPDFTLATIPSLSVAPATPPHRDQAFSWKDRISDSDLPGAEVTK